VEAIADLGFLEFTEVGIEGGEEGGQRGRGGGGEIRGWGFWGRLTNLGGDFGEEVGFGKQGKNAITDHLQPCGVEALGFVVFVHQAFELLQGAVELGAGEGRGEVVEDHRLGAAFGLGAFPRIVDDEGIEVGQGAKHGFGVAVLGEADAFAGEPF
jgi:hypothetical protein